MPPDYDPGVVPAIHEARMQKDRRRSTLCTQSFEIVSGI